MTASAPAANLGRHVFGVATLAFGVVALAWPDIYNGLQPSHRWDARAWQIFVCTAAAAQICGGAALQFRRTAKTGAAILGAVYLVFAFLCVPRIVAKPQVYNNWGNFFEQFSLATGAVIVYARLSPVWAPDTLKRISRILFGLCAASFAAEQAVYLQATATLVPKWLPPSQTFWAVATTVAFTLAAISLLTNRMALLATRMLKIMLVSFGLLVWVPLLLSDPHNHGNWSETAETFAIAGVAWILADLLSAYRLNNQAR